MLKKYRGEGALLLNTLIWGGTFVIIKNALQDVSPMLFVSIRFTLAALIIFPFLFKILKKTNKAALFAGFILGVIYFLGFATQTIGLNYTTATKSAFITGTFIIFTPIFQLIIEKRMPKKGNIIGIILVLIGLMFLSSRGSSFFDIFKEIGSNFNLGDFFTLICAIFFALYIVYIDIYTKRHDFKPLVFMQIAVTGISGIIFSVLLSLTNIETIKFTFNGNLIFAVLYTALLATIITTTLQTKFQKEVSPTKAGIIFSFEPIFSAVFAFFVLSEKISNFGLLGCVFIFSGLLATELIDKKRVSYGQK